MAIKKYKPTTSARRGASVVDTSHLTKKRPEKSLTTTLAKKSGRNSSGRITVRHQGGGRKRKYRIIDFKRQKIDIKAVIEALEYDPNRSCFIALIKYTDGEKSYILAPFNVKVGDEVISTRDKKKARIGDSTTLENIPLGTQVFNIEIYPGKGGQVARSGGATTVVMGKDSGMVQVKMPSGEYRLFRKECMATIGQASNIDNNNIVIGKAGRKRHMGIRPTVRGKVMNPVDHPHGGGEGRQPIGLIHPKTPWGAPALGYKTRKKKKASSKLIVKRRGKKR